MAPGNLTVWAQAVTAIMASLNASGAPVEFYRARFETAPAETTTCSAIPNTIDCKYDCANDSVKIDYAIVVRFDVPAPPVDGEPQPVDLAADPLILWAWKQLRLDPTLGQTVEDTYIDKIEFGYVDKSATDQISADMTIRVEVEVDRNDPSINKTYGSQLSVKS